MNNKQTKIRLVSTIALVILANLLMTNVVLAGANTRTYSDPGMGTTNPKYMFCSVPSPVLSSDSYVGCLSNTELNNSINHKVKAYSKSQVFINQTESALRENVEIISFTR
jgi:hypothetical protein